jgi:hypothetical protein
VTLALGAHGTETMWGGVQVAPPSACVCTTRPSTSTSTARSPLPRSASATETGTTPLCVAPSVMSGPVGGAVNSGTWSSRSTMSERCSWNCADGETAAHSVQVHPITSRSASTPRASARASLLSGSLKLFQALPMPPQPMHTSRWNSPSARTS